MCETCHSEVRGLAKQAIFDFLKENLKLQVDYQDDHDSDGRTIFLDLALKNPETGKLETVTGIQFDV